MARSCVAPQMALYFAPSGFVYACDRTRYPLGSIADSSLVEIWEGARRQTHAAWVGSGDLSHGCSDCDQPAGEWTQSSTFDDRVSGPLSGYPEYLDFALSNRCNLQCVMCDGDLSSSIRSQREGRPPLENHYDDRFFDQLRGFLPHVREASFKGGEPFLSPLTFRVFDMLIEDGLTPKVIVTTNGTVWNASVERYVGALEMDVFLSVDGITAQTVESIRVGVDHARLVEHIARFRSAVRATGRRLILNYCLMQQNWHELAPFLRAAEDAGDLVSILPVLAPPEHALLRLPRGELAAVVEQMEADGARHGLTGSNPVWDAQMTRLRAALEAPRPRDGIPVEVTLERTRSAPEDRDLPAEDALLAWGDGPLLHLTLHESVVVAADAPASLPAPLATAPWIGAYIDESFLDLLAGALGPVERITLRSGVGREFDSVAAFSGAHGVRELRAIGLTGEIQGGTLVQRLLIGYRASRSDPAPVGH